jgi:hypothetical protein
MGVRRLVFKGDDIGSTGKYAIKSFGVGRKLVDRLKRRATLANKIANSTVEKVKKNREDDELETADGLGVKYDSQKFNSTQAGKNGRRGQQKWEKAASLEIGHRCMKGWDQGASEEKIRSGFSVR